MFDEQNRLRTNPGSYVDALEKKLAEFDSVVLESAYARSLAPDSDLTYENKIKLIIALSKLK